MNSPDIIIGAKGWRHASWEGTFYPDDLPVEWQLPYYSNEFDSVLVPADYLHNADPDSLQSWIEDSPENFRFFLELPVAASGAWLEKVLNTLVPRLGGVLFTDASAQQPYTVELIDTVRHYAPVVASRDALHALGAPSAAVQNVGCYWRPEEINLDKCGGALGIAELGSDVRHDPKMLKNILQHCRSLQGATTIGVFFGGDAPQIEEMRNAIMILQMMG
jgi:hypothetical protein